VLFVNKRRAKKTVAKKGRPKKVVAHLAR